MLVGMGAETHGRPRILGERRVVAEIAALRRALVYAVGEGVRDGGGRPVVLVPGFLAGDASMRTMGAWLRRTGHRTYRSGIALNVDCSGAAISRLVEDRLEPIVERTGERVVLVGQSRGGLFARSAAVRRPDLVAGVVSLGSPHRRPFGIHPALWVPAVTLGLLGMAGARGVMTRRCFRGDCCADVWRELAGPFPADVTFTSVYSRSDGIVDWHACLDPAAVAVEVPSSHLGMALHPATYRTVAAALAGTPRHRVAAPGDNAALAA